MTCPILPGDPAFPQALFDLPAHKLQGCAALFVRGTWPPRPGVAIVGTRNPTPEALEFTRNLAAAVTSAGWTVWSGGALGVDACAHTAAMDHGGTTVVVCPSGLDVTYPPEHADLFARVLSTGGALVSRFEDDVKPEQRYFHRRNDLLACLTFATVVIQASFVSGSRSTARAARRLGRPLYVVPHAPWDPRGQGCAAELALGARPLVSTGAFIEGLRQVALFPGRATREHPREPAGAARAIAQHARASHVCDAHAARVLEVIGEMPVHIDDLCEKSSLPFATVTAALLTLTLQAVVVEAPAGFYRRPPL